MDYIRETSRSEQYERYLEYLAEKEDEMYQDKVYEDLTKESEENGRRN